MATGLSSLIDMANLVGAVRGNTQTTRRSGGTQTTSSTQTQKRDVDQAGIDRIVQKMLTGQGGQASISGAARGAGLYNSSTEQLLLNDLNARIAGEIANVTAPTTTTSEQTTVTPDIVQTVETPGIGLKGLLAPLAVASLAKGPLENLLGLGGSSSNALSSLTAGATAATPMFSLASGGGAPFASSMLDNITAGPGLAASMGVDMSQLAPQANILSQVPILGPLMSVFNGGLEDGTFGTSLFTSGLGGILSSVGMANPITAIALPVMGVLSSLFGGNMSVVCTALMQRGLLDKAEYEAGQSYLRTLHPYTRKGYYFWGEPLAKKILAGSKIATAISLPFAKQRTKLLAKSAPAWKLPLGLATKYIGEPACYALGWFLTKTQGETNGLVRAYCSK